MSSGSTSPDLGDTWHQGLHMSSQWEADLELGSDNNSEDEKKRKRKTMRNAITKN